MNISKLLKGTDIKYNKDFIINNISCNSKEINKGDLFIAIKGHNDDGHNYIEEAFKRGAVCAIINDDRYNDFKDMNVLCTNDTKITISKISSNYYDNPSDKFFLIGITGTKGKTTTSFMIKKVLNKKGYKVGLIGTTGIYINNKKINDTDRTTPDSINLQKIFRYMVDNKCKYVVMEVSSISLKEHRVDNSNFDVGIFLNLSKDHIGLNEHKDMEEYFISKTKLFNMVKLAIINIDDNYGKRLLNMLNIKYLTYSLNDCKNIIINNKETKYTFDNENITVSMPGLFEVYNSLSSIVLCKYLNIDYKYIKEGLSNIKVKGRNEVIGNIIIDYAHNPSSLENILLSIKNYVKGKIICVFGCGGNRDKEKRPIMGEISGKYSDYTIITSDNPRYENKIDIIKDIEQGIKKVTNNYKIIVDRKEAIKYAIEKSKKDDIILLAGKGHEIVT